MKQGTRRETDAAAGDAVTRTGAKAPARKKAAARAPAKKTAANKTAAAGKTARKSGEDAKGSAGVEARGSAELEMLAEQNAALLAELEHAKVRISQLEALHADVINRIDWVIDSLQTVLEEKR